MVRPPVVMVRPPVVMVRPPVVMVRAPSGQGAGPSGHGAHKHDNCDTGGPNAVNYALARTAVLSTADCALAPLMGGGF